MNTSPSTRRRILNTFISSFKFKSENHLKISRLPFVRSLTHLLLPKKAKPANNNNSSRISIEIGEILIIEFIAFPTLRLGRHCSVNYQNREEKRGDWRVQNVKKHS